MSKRKSHDPDTEAALSVVEMEKNQEVLKEAEQLEKEKLLAQSYQMAGQIKTAMMFSKFGDVSRLMWLKQVKDSKVYRALGSWDNYCEFLGLDRRTTDENLQNLSMFGKDFLETVASLSVGYRELRKLRQLTQEGDVVIQDECITIGDETIPISKDYAEDLQVAIESILENKNKQLSEQAATIKAKDKVLKDKEALLNKQAKEITKLEGHAAEVGYTPAEEKLMQDMDNARTIIDGFLMKFDPERAPLPEDASPRMRAKLMHTLDYFRRVILAAFDTAADIYGEPEVDDDWVPPHQRQGAKRPEQAVEPDGIPDEDALPKSVGDDGCESCGFHKGMSNKAKGVRIPGKFGKCTKPGGLCEIYPQEA